MVVPRQGEAFASWVERFAVDHEIPPGEAALVLGLQVRPSTPDVRPLFYGIACTRVSTAGLAASTGLDRDEIDAMHLSRYADAALDFTGLSLDDERTISPLIRREWMLAHSSRACPRCLGESAGVWPLWWRLGLAGVCPTHHVRLVDACPRCCIPLRRGYVAHPRGLSRVTVSDLTRCGNYSHRNLCGQLLEEIPTVPVEQDLVDAQRIALEVVDGKDASIAGEPVRRAEWFSAHRFLAAAIRFASVSVDLPGLGPMARSFTGAMVEHFNQRRSASHQGNAGMLQASPATAEHAAGLLAVGSLILSSPDPDACADRIRPLAEAAARARGKARHNPLRVITLPAVLSRVMAGVDPTPSRVAGGAAAERIRTELGFRHLPHLVSPVDYADLVATFLPGTAEPTGRRLAALAAARLLGASSWPRAAQVLEMDARRAARVCDVVVRRITDPTGFWAAVRTLVDRMAEQPLVDYAARRTHLVDLHEVPAEVLRPACHVVGSPVTPERCRHAAAWVWTELTGGDVREAPAYTVEWDASRESIREGARRFSAWLTSPVETVLRGWAAQHMAARGVL